jgi:agmatine/peptidylarginine deiminase
MTYKKGDIKYRHLNQLTGDYVNAMNGDAAPEELHCLLRDLLAEAIKTEITLEHLLRVLSGSSIEESDTEKFIENVSRHYAYGVTAAKVKKDEDDARKKTLEKIKKSQR